MMTESSLSTGNRKQKIFFKCVANDSAPVAISGDAIELGQWDVASAVVMNSTPRPQGGFECTASIELPQGATVEYKFIKRLADGPRWESGYNHRITVIPGLQTLETDFRE